MTHHVIGFVDGENLVARYQAMVSEGKVPRSQVKHIKDVLIWHPKVTTQALCDFTRLSYYQTVVGDDVKLNNIREEISNIEYQFHPSPEGEDDSEFCGSLFPKVYKKETKKAKTKSVDINLTVDALRHARQSKFDVIFIFSGDGDYIPLIEEISRQGKQVWVAAFSSGLNHALKYSADEFFDLDGIFFEVDGTKS